MIKDPGRDLINNDEIETSSRENDLDGISEASRLCALVSNHICSGKQVEMR